jgi:CheY-like chemotaxis protein
MKGGGGETREEGGETTGSQERGLGTSVPSDAVQHSTHRSSSLSSTHPSTIPNPSSAIPLLPSSSRLSIFLLGATNCTEFHDARSTLECWGTVHAFAKIDAAATALAEGDVVPDVIVIAQAFPGQFSHQVIDRLRRLAPLARVVGLMGSWCEGEMRTGAPWPGVVRTYWHQWAARCGRELCRMANGQCCSWTLPPTASEEERLLADMNPFGLPPQRGLVLICAKSREMAQWLSAACRSRGFATVWQHGPSVAHMEGAVAAIFDSADLNAEEHDDLRRLTERLHPAPVVVLLAFPRCEDRRRALSAGAAVVVSKPLVVEDLFWELERAMSAAWSAGPQRRA